MYSKNHKPTKAQKDFQDWIRANFANCQNCFAPATDGHHILGAAAHHNKQWIGQWAFTMLCYRCNHEDDRLPGKQEQLIQFVRGPLQEYWRLYHDVPMTKDEVLALSTWSR